MTNPADTEKQSACGFLFWCVTAFFAFLVLYVLSLGPAIKLSEHHPGIWAATGALYRPLGFVANHSEPARHFLNWYARLWGAKD